MKRKDFFAPRASIKAKAQAQPKSTAKSKAKSKSKPKSKSTPAAKKGKKSKATSVAQNGIDESFKKDKDTASNMQTGVQSASDIRPKQVSPTIDLNSALGLLSQILAPRLAECVLDYQDFLDDSFENSLENSQEQTRGEGTLCFAFRMSFCKTKPMQLKVATLAPHAEAWQPFPQSVPAFPESWHGSRPLVAVCNCVLYVLWSLSSQYVMYAWDWKTSGGWTRTADWKEKPFLRDTAFGPDSKQRQLQLSGERFNEKLEHFERCNVIYDIAQNKWFDEVSCQKDSKDSKEDAKDKDANSDSHLGKRLHARPQVLERIKSFWYHETPSRTLAFAIGNTSDVTDPNPQIWKFCKFAGDESGGWQHTCTPPRYYAVPLFFRHHSSVYVVEGECRDKGGTRKPNDPAPLSCNTGEEYPEYEGLHPLTPKSETWDWMTTCAIPVSAIPQTNSVHKVVAISNKAS